MRQGATKPGVLILVAGPSGSGKDTLIAAARHALSGNCGFVFPSRFITRAGQIGEEHIFVSREDFDHLRSEGLFFLDWTAHGLSYGLPASVRDDLEAGRAAVFNISRRMIKAAREKWRCTHVISLTVEPEVLRQRLQARGRESEADIEARVCRASDEAYAIDGPVHVLDNSGPLRGSIEKFLSLLLRLGRGAMAERMPAHGFEDAAAMRLTEQGKAINPEWRVHERRKPRRQSR
jgi:phosphonate metabolism protein PhnN/1,5-bisphosphokinase (PRPP-forming)